MAKDINRKVTIYVNGKEVENTIQSLRAEIKKLENAQKKAILGSEEYIRTTEEIARLKDILVDHKASAQNIGLSWKDTAEKLANYSNILMGVQTAMQMFDATVGTLKDLSHAAAELDDVYADVQKTTGLTKEQVESLNKSFSSMDTRTSREQLNQLAYEAGKLGISAERDVLGFVAASDKINIALGDVLGQGAMVTVGKLAQVYSSSTKQLSDASGDLETQMLRIGSAVNMLGQSSTANEAYLVEFLSRMGGIATQANLSADAILGFASALDQDMMKQEMSATAFQKFIMQMIKKPAEFAQAAHMDIKSFSNLMEKDMNEALIRVLEGFQGSGGLISLQPIFEDLGLDAARAASVISAMANSIDKVREAQAIANQELETGNSVLNEFNTKNNTMQAEAEKAKKRFEDVRIELGNELYPVLIKLQKTSTVGLKAFAEVLKFAKEHKMAVATLVTLIAYLNAARIKHTASVIAEHAASLKNLVTKKLEASWNEKLAVKQAYLTVKREKDKLSAIQQQIAINKKIIADKAEYAAIGANSVVLAAERNLRLLETQAISQQTAVTKASTAASKAFNAVVSKTPWGLLLMGLATVVAEFSKYKDKVKEAKEESRRLAEKQAAIGEASQQMRVQIDKDLISIQRVLQVRGDESSLLTELNSKYGGVFGKYNTLARWYEVLRQKGEAYVQTLYLQAQAQALIDDAAAMKRKIEEYKKMDKTLIEGAMNLNFLEGTVVRVGGFFEGLGNKISAVSDNLWIGQGSIQAISEALSEAKGPIEQITQNLMDIDTYNENNKNNAILGLEQNIRENLRTAADLNEESQRIINEAGINIQDNTLNELSGVSSASDKAKEKAAKAAAAWKAFSEAYDRAVDKMNGKQLTGVSKLVSDIDNSIARLRDQLNTVDDAHKEEAENMLKSLDQMASAWKKNEILKYLEKAEEGFVKMNDGVRSVDDENLSKVQSAVAKLRGQFKSIDDAILQYQADLNDVDEEEKKRLSSLIEKYQGLKSELASAVLIDVSKKIDRPSVTSGRDSWSQNVKDKVNETAQKDMGLLFDKSALDAYGNALSEIEAKYDEYRKKLKEQKNAEDGVASALEGQIKLEEAKQDGERDNSLIESLREEKKRHEDNANGIQKEIDGIQTLQSEAEKMAEKNSLGSFFDRLISGIEKYASVATEIFGSINSIIDNQANKELKKQEEQKDAAIASLDEQLKEGLISQEEYNEQKEELENSYKEKEKQTNKEIWKRKKALSLSEASIQSALAILNAWNSMPYPANLIPVGIATAMGAAQIAAIATEPAPYAKGGYVPKEQIYKAGEAGEEWVASHKLLADGRTAPIIDALERYQRGNRKALDDIPMARLNSQLAMSAARELGKRSSVTKAEDQFSSSLSREQLAVMKDIAEYLKDPRNRQAVISRQTLSDFDKSENYLRSAARL